IRLDEPPPAPAPAPAPVAAEPAFVIEDDPPTAFAPPRRRSAAAEVRAEGEDVLSSLISPYALPTYVMAFGAFLVITFLFFPLLDLAKIASREANIKAGELREQKLERQFQRKKDKTPTDEEARNKSKESWERERENLTDDVNDAKISADKWNYWYLWGQLFGFLLTALAALAYMAPKMPPTRRVVGAIVFTAVLLLVFLRIMLLKGVG